MPTRPTWKFAEDRLARLFKTRRRPLSGGNQGGGRDDSLHERLFLESKYSQRHALWTLYRETKEKADKEGRIPVIGLQEFRKKGILLVIHSNDLQRVAAEAVDAITTRKRIRPLRTVA